MLFGLYSVIMIKESARPATIAFIVILLVGISVADHEQVNPKQDLTTGGIKWNGSTTSTKLLLTGRGYHRKLLANSSTVDSYTSNHYERCRDYCMIVKCPHPC
ncbi:unnamed protein product [Urochloa decumbens]|uniref:Uncharacterized protein n=1 Tax=Urochloa decumbens TaxID=240449 RepID=A0ABC9D8Z5_9POAL